MHAHTPAAHVCIAPHAFAQAPQFCASVCTSTQLVPQSVPPFGQAHLPATHVWSASHALPQPPQFAADVLVSTHAPPHEVRPLAQGA